LGKRSGGLGTTLVLALVIVVLGVALGVGLARFGETLPLVGPLLGEKPPRTTTGPVVVEGIRELDQLATVRWTESVPVTRESGGDVWERVFGGEKVLLIATGNVEAGVDLGDIREDDVSVKGDVVTIDLPEAEILSASLDEETTRVYDRDFSPLNLHPDDELVEQARLRAVGKISASARENGILDTAESNAEDSIRAFVTTLGFEKVKFR
jgi:predicted RNA-binding protein